MSNQKQAGNEQTSVSSKNRRTFLRGMGTVGLSTIGITAASNPVAAQSRSEYNKKAAEVFKFNKELYGAKEAKILTDKLVEIDRRGLINNVSEEKEEEVFNNFTEYLLDNTKNIARNIKENRRKKNNRGQYTREDVPGRSQRNSNSLGFNSRDEFTYLSTSSNISLLSTGLSTTITDEGTSGGGTTETRFLDSDSYMEARCISSGYANSRAWVERAGHFYPSSSGNYELTCNYSREGTVDNDGSASIKLFVEELGGNRREEIVDVGSNDGSVTRTEGFYLSGETDYIAGLYLNTEIRGYGWTLYSDYYAGDNGVVIDSLSIDEI